MVCAFGEEFPIGTARVLRASDGDGVTIAATGVTLHEPLVAAVRLDAGSIAARVIDCYSVNPLDTETLRTAAAGATGGRVITVEDHYPKGRLGEPVLAVLVEDDITARVLAVRHTPGSAAPTEQLAAAIGAAHIAESTRTLAVDEERRSTRGRSEPQSPPSAPLNTTAHSAGRDTAPTTSLTVIRPKQTKPAIWRVFVVYVRRGGCEGRI